MVRDVNGSDAALAHLRRALAAAENDEARYQIREALQLCMAAADGDSDGAGASGAGVDGVLFSTDGGRPE